MKPSHFITPRSLADATFSGHGPIAGSAPRITGLDIALAIVLGIVIGALLAHGLAS